MSVRVQHTDKPTAMTFAAKPYYWPNTKEISYGDSPPIATRAGWMALGCLPFVLYDELPPPLFALYPMP